MELRCPHCCSPEVEPDSCRNAEALRCENCDARFERASALVTVFEAETRQGGLYLAELFRFDAARAAIELRQGDGALAAASPDSDADELNRLLDAAQAVEIIAAEREQTRIYLYPLSLGEPEPLLAVDPGSGPTLLGSELKLGQGEGEDPITYTVRVLEEAVAQANRLAGERAADGERLDRIAEFMNRPGQWNGGDVCEFLASELEASGRPCARTSESAPSRQPAPRMVAPAWRARDRGTGSRIGREHKAKGALR